MKLREILSLVEQISHKSDISPPKICGGTPRDKLLGLLKTQSVPDIDITTCDDTIHILAKNIAIELGKQFKIDSKTAEDGHTSIFLGDFKLDFSSNFIDSSIIPALAKLGIQNPSDKQKEMFSRDFTCNALLMSLDLKTITDPTNLGIDDIHKRIIRTCLDPYITFTSNPNRIIRVIYLASKLDFDVDPIVIKWISENRSTIRLSNDNYLIKNIDKAMAKNPERAVDVINKTGLWDYIPITEELNLYLNKKATAQWRSNFDYGEGLYMNLDKYKSVSDFRRKRRKKRMKEIKRLKDMKFK